MIKRILILTLVLLAFAMPCHAQGVVVFGSTDPPINLLTNPDFGTWSNSTLAQGTTGVQADFEYGTAIRSDDPDDGDNSADYSVTNCAIARTNSAGNGAGGDDYFYTIDRDNPGAATQNVYVALSGLTVGHDYKFSCYVKDGTDAISAACQLQIKNSARTATLNTTNLAASAAWADFSVIWRATETNNVIEFYLDIDAADETMLVDEIKVIEVTPGCVGADALACDGWYKDSTLDVLREPNGTNSKDGSYYALKCVPSAAGDWISWPLLSIRSTNYWVEKFSNKQVALGFWCKTSTANHLRVQIEDGVGGTFTSYHSGGGSWEWLEANRTISSSATKFEIVFYLTQSSGTVYISQPVLTCGSTINQGQYYPTNKIVLLENDISSHKFDGSATISDGSGTLYLGGDTSAKLPYGAKALKIRSGIKDTGSAGTDCYFYAGYDVSACIAEYINSPYGRAISSDCYVEGWTSLNADGDFEYTIEEGTVMTISDFEYTAVEVR